MKKQWLWALPMLMLLATPSCGSSAPQEERVEPGMEEEAPIVTESEKENMLDFEESEADYKEAKQTLETAQPTIEKAVQDQELEQELEAAKEGME
ncbi:MAG: hypothetical protein II588_00105 [Paludibacteraceae bacterium]|nr:hypothetical protein [Paludibacteraceae bacterium]